MYIQTDLLQVRPFSHLTTSTSPEAGKVTCPESEAAKGS